MHAGSAIGFEGGLVEFWNYLIQSGEIWGYLGAVVTIGTYSMRTMIPLRVVGICANILFIIYGLVAEVYPQFALHVILLPLNIGRLYQMVRLVAQVKEASGGSLSMDWIKGFTHRRVCRAGETIFLKGDTADAMFYPVSGRYRLEEIDVPIGPGEVVGEIGLVTPDNKRTQTFRCEEDGELLVIGYNQVKQLYFQNPKFGFFFLKLITQRLLANHRNMQERLEQALAAAR